MKKFIISIDQGTTSSRAILFDSKAKIVFKSQFEFKQYFPKNGWVEHNPKEIWLTTIKALKNVIKKASRLKGKIIIAPPSAIKDKWVRKFSNVRYCLASGWMIVKQRAKQSKIELPLVISDHADWNELTNTILRSNAKKIWLTHGRTDALKYWCMKNNINAEALDLIESN